MKGQKEKPLYYKVYKELQKRIENNQYEVDNLIPSEAALQKEFGVSRITIRRSLQDLELAGYIRIIKGKGAFVLPFRKYSNLVGVSSFSNETVKQGGSPSSIILEFEELAATGIVSEYLQLEEGEPIYHLKRLRLQNGRIIGLHETFIARKNGFTIKENELNEKTSIYALYEERGFPIERASETIEASIPSSEVKRDLYMKDGEPIFRRERITYTTDNIPLEFSINSYKANEYKYVIDLKKE